MDHFHVGDLGTDPDYGHAHHDPYGSTDVHDHLGAEHPDHDATRTYWEVDNNGDGRPDEWDYDDNGDGKADETFLDHNYDGNYDEMQRDTNFDGRVDVDMKRLAGIDSDVRWDDDHDGYYDRLVKNRGWGDPTEQHIHEPVGDQAHLGQRHQP